MGDGGRLGRQSTRIVDCRKLLWRIHTTVMNTTKGSCFISKTLTVQREPGAAEAVARRAETAETRVRENFMFVVGCFDLTKDS